MLKLFGISIPSSRQESIPESKKTTGFKANETIKAFFFNYVLQVIEDNFTSLQTQLTELSAKVDGNQIPDYSDKPGYALYVKGDGSGTEWVDPGYIPVSSVTLQNPISFMTVGSTYQLYYGILPNSATDKTVAYYVDNDSVATISPTGVVNALGLGVVTVHIVTSDQAKTDSFVITVTS